MALIPKEMIDKVRTSVNIADYIGQYVQLRKQGQNLFGLCPFQAEHTPSFSVSEGKQIFQCFSCGRGGNVFQFVQDYDHVNFPEAVVKVAAFANISLGVQVTPTRRPEDPSKTRQKQLLREVTDMMHHLLVNTKGGEPALAYLTNRGLSQATIDHFEVGYVPADRSLMKKFLDSRKATYDEERASGLFVEDDQGHLFDRFNDRVMFPLKDAYGDVIGFSGRILTKEASSAKYLNSPETELFNKRDVLFNLDQAKATFKDNGALLFEGFMDVISAFQAGVPNGIASMGTSLTQEQVTIISRQTKRLTICYDGDAPGQHAADRALELVRDHPQLQVGVVVLPDGQDPDEFIQAHGAEAFSKQVQHTLTPIGFRLNYLVADRDMTSDQDKLAYIDAALKEISQEPEPVAQSVYLKQVSDLTGVPAETLRQQLPAVPKRAPSDAEWGTPPPPPEAYDEQPEASAPVAAPHYDRYEKAERQLLQLSFHDSTIATRLHRTGFIFPDADYQNLFDAWLAYAKDEPAPTVAGFMDSLDPSLSPTVATLDFEEIPDTDDDGVTALIQAVGQRGLKQALQRVKQQMTQAQQLGDEATVDAMLDKYIQLQRQLKAAAGE
ncbi:DNA primase G [Lacticaseibacillus camelliae DSM 22697 = JCM 13995]|uniref:DNA primase n=1 Tax=Lacticaseibacillus camelliae DSM 22697 = JCM 13995 TaxID=1423730 RepID=A0A0R2FBR0_9LACO|nr:DNA primase [Lacticaseibacillus camelliae]KRN22180.1 DNA primase G [Lacticaseibacillus camelliae DSM 22697 = JCM 13995]